MNDTKRRALSRTWATVTTYRECGVVVEVSRDTVTISRDVLGGKISATVNGEAADLACANRLLSNADSRTVTAETLAPLPTIGKARAAQLHRIMGRVGLPSFQHYGLAAVYAHPRNEAALKLSSGSSVIVRPADRALFLPDVGVLTVEGQGYRVPASLFAAVRGALALEGVGA